MSRAKKGAASAAPSPRLQQELAEADQWEAEAFAAIEAVQDLADAEALLGRVKTVEQAMRINKIAGDRETRWRALRLRAERRYGELLGPVEQQAWAGPGKRVATGDAFSTGQRDVRRYARQVAAVPGEQFEEYLDGNAEPSRTGLLRKFGPKKEQREPSQNKRRKPSESGQRRHALHAEKRNGRRPGDLWLMQIRVAEAVGVLETFDLEDLDWDEETEDLVQYVYDDLARLSRWTEHSLDVTVAHMDELGRQRKIQALRARADDPSSTRWERENAARLANRLEAKRNAKQLVS